MLGVIVPLGISASAFQWQNLTRKQLGQPGPERVGPGGRRRAPRRDLVPLERREGFDRYQVVSAADLTNARREAESDSLGVASQEAGEIGASLAKARAKGAKTDPLKPAWLLTKTHNGPVAQLDRASDFGSNRGTLQFSDQPEETL